LFLFKTLDIQTDLWDTICSLVEDLLYNFLHYSLNMYKTELAYVRHTYETLRARRPFCNIEKRDNPKSFPRVIFQSYIQSYQNNALSVVTCTPLTHYDLRAVSKSLSETCGLRCAYPSGILLSQQQLKWARDGCSDCLMSFIVYTLVIRHICNEN
jgi:hypothetical protein